MIFDLYSAGMRLATPLLNRLLLRRMARGKEDPDRIEERRGHASLARPEGRLFWIHGASVGECQTALALIERLLEDDPALSVLLTSGTVTSAQLMADRLPARALHQYVPIDNPVWVRRFLAHWQPDAAVFVESDLWPNLVLGTQARGIPLILANARMSEASFARWRRLSFLSGRLFKDFALILASNAEQQTGFKSLTGAPVTCVGNLKRAAAPLSVDETRLVELKAATGTRPILLAASTHAGEEEEVVAAHRKARETFEDLLTIVAPRHPIRGGEIAELAESSGLQSVQRSAGTLPGAETDLYIADTLGEMGTLFALADLVFVAGSLVPVGGHNPLEPAHFGKPILFGPLMPKNADIAADMLAANAAIEVSDGPVLGTTVEALLRDRDRRDAIGAAASAFAEGQGRIAEEMARLVVDAVRRSETSL